MAMSYIIILTQANLSWWSPVSETFDQYIDTEGHSDSGMFQSVIPKTAYQWRNSLLANWQQKILIVLVYAVMWIGEYWYKTSDGCTDKLMC